MDDFLILDYEEIIKEYDEQLVSKLRDFGRDYLKFWIPEENNVLSLLNLFFSIVQSGKKKIKVKINQDKLNKQEIHKLETYINKFSLYKIQKENVFSIPMKPNNRSLNLSNAVSIIVYESWRQHNFEGSV